MRKILAAILSLLPTAALAQMGGPGPVPDPWVILGNGNIQYPGGVVIGTATGTTNVGDVNVSGAFKVNGTPISSLPCTQCAVKNATNTFTAAQIINLNSGSLQAAQTGTVLQMGQANGVISRLELDSYAATSVLSCVRADGTAAAPTALTTNDEICSLNAWGYNGSAFVGGAARISAFAAAPWTASPVSRGTYWDFATTASADTSAVLTSRMHIENDGGITLNGASSTGAGTISGTNNQNAFTGFKVTNTTAGTASIAGFEALSDTVSAFFNAASSLYVAVPIITNRAYVIAGGGSGLALLTNTTQPIVFGINSNETGRFSGSTPGLLQLGVSGTLAGSLALLNATSGSITIQPTSGALGSAVWTVPIGTDTFAGTSSAQTLTNKTISGSVNTLSNIANASLTNSTISGVALGNNLFSLSGGTHFTEGAYNGSGAITLALDATTANTASTIVARDGSGNFSANAITLATSLTDPLIVGGGSAASSLELRSTSGTGSGDSVIVTGGTNGGTRIATFLGSGLSGFGSAAGAANPTGTVVEISGNATAVSGVVSAYTTLLHLTGADAVNSSLTMDTFGAIAAINLRASGGTAASKSAVAGGAFAFVLNGFGWDGSAYGVGAQITTKTTTSAWSGTNHGMGINFLTTADGSTSTTTRMQIGGDGTVVVGTPSGSAVTGAGNINISGAFYANGVAVSGTGTVTSVTCGTGLSGGTITGTGTCANAGVLSIAGNTGAFTLAGGITNSGNAIQLAFNSATTQQFPTNPTGTSSSTGVMMGLGKDQAGSGAHPCTITPVNSTKIRFEIIGQVGTSASGSSSVTGKYGTGTAPSNGVAFTGNSFTQTINAGIPSGYAGNMPFTLSGIATGLSIGTAYWFDVDMIATGATEAVYNITCTASEQL